MASALTAASSARVSLWTAAELGPSGSDVSTDQGRTWTRFDNGSFDTVDCVGPHACWASGEQGRVAYLAKSK